MGSGVYVLKRLAERSFEEGLVIVLGVMVGDSFLRVPTP
jgi:hypothetical protein